MLASVSYKGKNRFERDVNNVFGENRISFGAIKFEPGIYADYPLENGMVLSPYARAELQQRFGYTNKASIDGVDIHFDDSNFSTALSTGFAAVGISDTLLVPGE